MIVWQKFHFIIVFSISATNLLASFFWYYKPMSAVSMHANPFALYPLPWLTEFCQYLSVWRSWYFVSSMGSALMMEQVLYGWFIPSCLGVSSRLFMHLFIKYYPASFRIGVTVKSSGTLQDESYSNKYKLITWSTKVSRQGIAVMSTSQQKNS